MSKVDWETINCDTQRLAVPGGWIYRVTYYEGPHALMAATFVPAPTLSQMSAAGNYAIIEQMNRENEAKRSEGK